MADRWLTQREASERLGIGLTTLKKLRDAGEINSMNFGYRQVRIRESAVKRYEKKRRNGRL